MKKNTYKCENCGALGEYTNDEYQFCTNCCSGAMTIFNLDKDNVIRPKRENQFGKGYIEGYQEGKEEGYNEGYNEGYTKAVDELIDKSLAMRGK